MRQFVLVILCTLLLVIVPALAEADYYKVHVI